MSELKDYIDGCLQSEYREVGVLSDTAVNKLTVYEHCETGKKLVLIRSLNRNDEVFRTLKSKNTNGLLPRIYEVSGEDDALYVLEEYIEGEHLFKKYCNTRPTQSELKNILLSICDSMELLHSFNIVHRDIKPNNVMIRNDGTVCIVDLSIAKMITENSSKDTMNLGTVGYAAPEQFGFSQSMPTTDIYAFGVLANQLALGVYPTTDVPKGRLGRIIKKCTSTQISNRYQSAEQLKKAIKAI